MNRSSNPRANHYSYSVYSDPAMAESFDELRFSGPIGELLAGAQEEVIARFLEPVAQRLRGYRRCVSISTLASWMGHRAQRIRLFLE